LVGVPDVEVSEEDREETLAYQRMMTYIQTLHDVRDFSYSKGLGTGSMPSPGYGCLRPWHSATSRRRTLARSSAGTASHNGSPPGSSHSLHSFLRSGTLPRQITTAFNEMGNWYSRCPAGCGTM
jgi:hypothetical protein